MFSTNPITSTIRAIFTSVISVASGALCTPKARPPKDPLPTAKRVSIRTIALPSPSSSSSGSLYFWSTSTSPSSPATDDEAHQIPKATCPSPPISPPILVLNPTERTPLLYSRKAPRPTAEMRILRGETMATPSGSFDDQEFFRGPPYMTSNTAVDIGGPALHHPIPESSQRLSAEVSVHEATKSASPKPSATMTEPGTTEIQRQQQESARIKGKSGGKRQSSTGQSTPPSSPSEMETRQERLERMKRAREYILNMRLQHALSSEPRPHEQYPCPNGR